MIPFHASHAVAAPSPRASAAANATSRAASGADTVPAAPSRQSLPLPLRLAVVYGLLIAATLLVVAGVTVAVARAHLQRTLDAQLRGTATSYQQGPALRAQNTSELAVQTRRWLGEHPLPAGEMAAIRIAGGRGRVLTSAGGLDLFEIQTPRLLLTDAHGRWWTRSGSEGAVRGLTVPILSDGVQLGTLVLLAYEKPIATTLSALLFGIGVASAIGLLLALLVGVLVVRRSLRPLTQMTAEVAAIEATGDLSRRIAAGAAGDEVGRLASAFDRMLARLEEAFRAQRRFLADASHELRTPLTVASCQLELLAGELDGEQRRSLALTTDELDRMARIVEDLLLLARLDEGAELRREPVEVELVLREALLRAMLLKPRDLSVEAEPNLHVLSDPDRRSSGEESREGPRQAAERRGRAPETHAPGQEARPVPPVAERAEDGRGQHVHDDESGHERPGLRVGERQIRFLEALHEGSHDIPVEVIEEVDEGQDDERGPSAAAATVRQAARPRSCTG